MNNCNYCARLTVEETNDPVELNAEISEIDFSFSVSDVLEIHDELPEYSGSYEITPLAYEAQTLATRRKTLNDDLTVLEIPIFEVSNEYGTTVNIGG